MMFPTQDEILQSMKRGAERDAQQIASLQSRVKELEERNNSWENEHKVDMQTLRQYSATIDQQNDRLALLTSERERAVRELQNIVNAERKNFLDDEEFRLWAQSRARFTLDKIADLRAGKEEAV